MNSILDLRKELIGIFSAVKGKRMPLDRAKELSNAAGKIIGTAKLQLEYASLRKEVPDVAFLNTQPKTPTTKRNRSNGK